LLFAILPSRSRGAAIVAIDPRCALTVDGRDVGTPVTVVRPLGDIRIHGPGGHRFLAADFEVVDELPASTAFGPCGVQVLAALRHAQDVVRTRASAGAPTAIDLETLRSELARAWMVAAAHDRVLPAAALINAVNGSRQQRGAGLTAMVSAAQMLGLLLSDVLPLPTVQRLRHPWTATPLLQH
jgi:hypothetical protein